MKTLRYILPALVLLSTSSIALGGDFQDGVDAANKGTYKAAYKVFLELAKQGDARAQYNLGFMYYEGLGVSKDSKEAFKWFRLAAYQGYADAQFYLGMMYLEGEVVPKDHVLAHMWFALSAARGVENAAHHREKCEENMSPSQIKKARAMATNWKSRK
jgi:hypothetical protein